MKHHGQDAHATAGDRGVLHILLSAPLRLCVILSLLFSVPQLSIRPRLRHYTFADILFAFGDKNGVSCTPQLNRFQEESETTKAKEEQVRSLFTTFSVRSALGVALIAGMVLGLLALPGCGGKRSTPEKAAEAYLKAAKNGDLDDMRDCCAPDMRDALDEMIKMTGKEKATKQLVRGGKLQKFKVLSAKVKDDWADVEVSMTVGGKKRTESLKFHKVNGEWLFDLPKEQKDAMKAGMEMMRDPEKAKKIMELMQRNMPKRTQ